MANSNRPAGLSPVQYLNGTPWNGGGRSYFIPSTDNNAYAIGDPVASAGSADSLGRAATVTLATAGTGNPIRGVIVGIAGSTFGGPYANPANINTTIIPATKTQGYYVLVVDDPWVIFEIQEESTGTALTVADVGMNANLVAGTNNGYVSGWVLDRTGVTTTATLQVRLLGLSPVANNDFGDYAKWRVLINNHELKAGTAGI